MRELTFDASLNSLELNSQATLGGVHIVRDYDGLSNKPQINGVTLEGNVSAETLGLAEAEDIPTKTSELTNDSGYLTSETDPVFTASPAHEITQNDIAEWNGKSDFSGNYEDLTNKPIIPTVPTNVSAFINDAGYLTTHQSLVGYATEEYVEEAISEVDIPTKTSDLVNDSGYITDAGVTSFNGNTGAVTYTAPVTSVNGNTGAVSGLAVDNAVVHISGTEDITGSKTFTKPVTIETNETEGFNLQSTTAGGYLYVTRGSGTNAVQMAIKSGASGGTFGTNTNHQFQFRTNNVARMTVGTDGSIVVAEDVASNSNNNQVATTKWVNTKLSNNAVSVTQTLSSGTEIGSISVGSTSTKLYAPPNELPTVTSSDNGKVLMVVSGAWAAALISSANGVSF